MDIPYILLTVLTFIIFLVGLAGLVLPVLPGIPIIWLGTVIYAVCTNFAKIGWWELGLFTVLTLFSIAVDYTANIIGAKKFGAGRWGIIGAVIGLILGIITLGPIGLILGPLVGAIIGELISGKSDARALKAGFGALVGFLSGVLIKFLIGLAIIGIFIWQII